MSITLAFETTTVTLPSDLLWADENAWLPVEQTVQRTLSGALLISSAAVTGGRPITLQAEDENSSWVSSDDVDTLRNLAVVPNRVLTLTLRGLSRSVIFRHHEGVAVEARPIVHYDDGADWYSVTIRLMEI